MAILIVVPALRVFFSEHNLSAGPPPPKSLPSPAGSEVVAPPRADQRLDMGDDQVEPTGDLRLNVKSAASLLPIPAARCTIVDGLNAESTRPLVADRDGRFPVPRRLPSTQRLWIQAQGFFDRHVPCEEWWGLTASAGDVVDVLLSPAGTLVVRVEDELGHGIPNATVLVVPWDDEKQLPTWNQLGWPHFVPPGFSLRKRSPIDKVIPAGTDARGECRFDELPAGIALFVQASGKAAQSTAKVTIPLEPPPPIARVTIRTTSTGTITGRILRSDGQPAPGQKVVISPSATDVDLRISNESGEYRYDGVPAGQYALQCSAPLARPVLVDVLPGKNTVAEVFLPELVPVTGRVVSAAGLGASPGQPSIGRNNSGVYVHAWADCRPVAMAIPDPDGRFSLELPPGAATLEIRRTGSPATLRSVQISAPVSGLEIPIDELVGALRFRLVGQAPPTVQVRVFHRLGAEDDPAHRALREESALVHSTRALASDGHGDFVYANLPAGTYDVLVDCGDAGCAWLRGIHVDPRSAVDLGALECGFGSVAGSVLIGGAPNSAGSEGGLAWPQVALTTPGTGSKHRSVQPGEGGRFEFADVPAGPWVLYLFANGADAVRSSYCDVYPETTVQRDLSVPEGLTSLHGTVRLDGQPLQGCRLHLGPADGPSDVPSLSWRLGVSTDTTGRYVFPLILAGKHRVTAALFGSDGSVVLAEHKELWATRTPAVLDFDLVTPGVVVTFRQGDEIHTDIGSVLVTSLTGEGTRASYARSSPEVTVPLFTGRQLVLWSRISESRSYLNSGWVPKYYGAVVERTPDQKQMEIHAAPGAMEVQLASGADVPVLRIESFEGRAPSSGGRAPELALEVLGPDRVRFVALPQGAYLRLESTTMACAPQRFYFTATGTVVRSWP